MSGNPFQALVIPLIIERLRQFSDQGQAGGGASTFGDRVAGAVTEQAAVKNSQLPSPALHVIDGGSVFRQDTDLGNLVLIEVQTIDFVIQVDEPQTGGKPGESATDVTGYRAACQAQILAQFLIWALGNADLKADDCTMSRLTFTERAGVIATALTGARQYHRITATHERRIAMSEAFLNPGGALWDGMAPFLWASVHIREDGKNATDGSGWCRGRNDAPGGHSLVDVRRSGADPPDTPC